MAIKFDSIKVGDVLYSDSGRQRCYIVDRILYGDKPTVWLLVDGEFVLMTVRRVERLRRTPPNTK
jgi:hypothetical protein